MPFTTTKPVGQFTDINGKPLDGQVFFGQPNLDPIANPITVYWDAAGTQPVTQPVVTVGGYPMNGSTRSNVFVNADYSILVRNRNGFTVFSAPNLPFEDSSDNQYFLQAGSGAVQRTVQSKLRDVVSVLDFGAVGDGVTDDYAAIQAACAAIQANGGGTLVFPKGRTYFVNQHRIDGGPNANGIVNFAFSGINGLVIEGEGSKLVMQGGWTRTADYSAGGFTFSYQNCIGLSFTNCSRVTINDLEIDGGANTITKVATAEGISYGLIISGCTYVDLNNVYVHHYCTDGLLLLQSGPFTNYIISKHIKVNNCRFHRNARQGCSVIQARYVTFTECEFSNTGQTGLYGSHSPAGGVDVEPDYYPGQVFPGVGTANGDDYTGDITFIGCRFIDNSGYQFVSTDYTKAPYPISFFGCTFKSSSKGVLAASQLTRFYSCFFDGVGLDPNFGVADSPSDCGVFESTFAIRSPDKAAVYFTGFSLAKLTVNGCRFTFTSPTARTAFGIQISATQVLFQNNQIDIAASEHNGSSFHVHSQLNFVNKSEGNRWNTAFAVAGKVFTIDFSATVSANEFFVTPTYISPGTSAWPRSRYATGRTAYEYLESSTGNVAFQGAAAPTTGAWTRGDIVWNSAPSAGGTPGWVCVSSGTPGTWKAMANLAP